MLKQLEDYKPGDIIFYRHNPTSDYMPCLIIQDTKTREENTGENELLVQGILPEYYEVKKGSSSELYVSYDTTDLEMKEPLVHVHVAQSLQDESSRPNDGQIPYFDPDEYYVIPTSAWIMGVTGDGWAVGDREMVTLSEVDPSLPDILGVRSELPSTIKKSGVKVTKKRSSAGTEHFVNTVQEMQERKFFPLLLPNLVDGFKAGAEDDKHGTIFEHNILGIFPKLGWITIPDGEDAIVVMRWDGDKAHETATKAHKDFKKNTLSASLSKSDGYATVTIKF